MATNLKEFNISTMGSLVNNTKEKSALVDFDMIPVMDSKDNNLIKKYSFSSLKVAINDQLSSVYTATDVLDKIKTVDGAGSGLDADLFDGYDSNIFIKGYNSLGVMNTDNVNVRLSSGFYESHQGVGLPTSSWYSLLHARHSNADNNYGIQFAGNFFNNNDIFYRSLQGNDPSVSEWSRLWHSNNDGSGSGLDADTLDGLHASSFIAQGSALSVSSLLVESGAKIKLNIDYPTFSWGGDTSYPTIYGSAIDRWFMMINPHIPYVQNGVNGYAGTTMQGATIRMASDTSATYSWDLGIGVCGVGADKFAIGRNNIPFIAINNGGGVSVANDISLGLHGRIVGGGASGSWGSINIAGTKGGYGGIRFESSGLTFMVRDSDGLSGIINDAGSWKWYWDGSGILAVGTVPYARLSGMQSLSSGTGLDGSSYNAGTAITWSLTAITSGNETVGALRYSGTGANNGQMNGGSSITTSTIRLNYNGIFYAVGLRFGASGSSSYSDERLKKYIKDIENATDLIYSLKPRMYKLRAKLGGINEYHYGLIAQEVVKVLEETGIEKTAFLQYPREEDEYFGIDYTQLIAPLIATVQELNTRLKALEKGNESWN